MLCGLSGRDGTDEVDCYRATNLPEDIFTPRRLETTTFGVVGDPEATEVTPITTAFDTTSAAGPQPEVTTTQDPACTTEGNSSESNSSEGNSSERNTTESYNMDTTSEVVTTPPVTSEPGIGAGRLVRELV